MVKSINDLRNMVVDVVKVKTNTDPTKTQGIRLRGLLSDILDTVQSLVDELGSSVITRMQNDEDIQNQSLLLLEQGLDTCISSIPDTSIFQKKVDVVTYDLNPYLLKTNALTSYTQLADKPYIAKFYNSTGILNQTIKKWVGIITPTTSSGFSIDISSAGFTTISNIQIQVERNSTVVSDIPIVSIKSRTTSSIVVNLAQTNTATVSIAGINVLSGLPLIFATNLSNILLHVEVTGY